MKNNKNITEYYDKQSDIKWIKFKEGKEDSYYEVEPGYNVEFNAQGEVIGLEILNYSKRKRRLGNTGNYNPSSA